MSMPSHRRSNLIAASMVVPHPQKGSSTTSPLSVARLRMRSMSATGFCVGYPTQKPVALMERILNLATDKGDVVLDPFCGCGTTIDAAIKLERRWLGIDITYIAVGLIQARLKDTYGAEIVTTS